MNTELIACLEAWETCNQRLLRDKLLQDDNARREYGELKVTLAASQMAGMDYTAAKLQLLQKFLDEERSRAVFRRPTLGRNR